MKYPLEGLRILDFSRVLAGPYATRMLADLGAEVLKVEAPEGDMTRQLGLVDGEISGFFLQHNVGKQNLCLDLKADGAKELIHDLVAVADIVVENFRPGVMDRLGIGWDALSKINPKLIMLSISGFGQTGPERERASYAPMMHAETGLLARQGQMNGQPWAGFSVSIGDTFSSLHGVIGVLAALRYVRETGCGQHVDIGMIDAVWSADDFANFVLDGIWTKEMHNGFWEAWDAPEGATIGIAGTQDTHWKAFVALDGLEDPAPPGAAREQKTRLRYEALAHHIRHYASFDALTERLDQAGLAWGRIRKGGAEALSQPSVKGRGIVVELEDGGAGSPHKTVQSPYKFSSASSGITPKSRGAVRGEHNYTALKAWLGVERADVDALAKKGVVQSPECHRATAR